MDGIVTSALRGVTIDRSSEATIIRWTPIARSSNRQVIGYRVNHYSPTSDYNLLADIRDPKESSLTLVGATIDWVCVVPVTGDEHGWAYEKPYFNTTYWVS